VWGIVTVTLLIAYGNGFRYALVRAFDSFGRSAVVAWPGQTSEQAGGERAGRRVRFELADLEAIRQEATLVRYASLESCRRVPWPTPTEPSTSPCAASIRNTDHSRRGAG